MKQNFHLLLDYKSYYIHSFHIKTVFLMYLIVLNHFILIQILNYLIIINVLITRYY